MSRNYRPLLVALAFFILAVVLTAIVVFFRR